MSKIASILTRTQQPNWTTPSRDLVYNPLPEALRGQPRPCQHCKALEHLALGLGLACAALTFMVALAAWLGYYGLGTY